MNTTTQRYINFWVYQQTEKIYLWNPYRVLVIVWGVAILLYLRYDWRQHLPISDVLEVLKLLLKKDHQQGWSLPWAALSFSTNSLKSGAVFTTLHVLCNLRMGPSLMYHFGFIGPIHKSRKNKLRIQPLEWYSRHFIFFALMLGPNMLEFYITFG